MLYTMYLLHCYTHAQCPYIGVLKRDPLILYDEIINLQVVTKILSEVLAVRNTPAFEATAQVIFDACMYNAYYSVYLFIKQSKGII